MLTRLFLPLCLLVCACGDTCAKKSPPFVDPTPVYAPNENRFVSRYEAVFLIDDQEAALRMAFASRFGPDAGGAGDLGGVLTTDDEPVAMKGNVDLRTGEFALTAKGLEVRGTLHATRGKAPGGDQVKLTLEGGAFFAVLDRLDPPSAGDDRTLVIKNTSAGANVTAGTFSGTAMMSTTHTIDDPDEDMLVVTIGNKATRALEIRSYERSWKPWNGHLAVAKEAKHPSALVTWIERDVVGGWKPWNDLAVAKEAKRPSALVTWIERDVDGGTARIWEGAEGEVIIDLFGWGESMTLHFDDLVMRPVSESANGTFTVSYSGSSSSLMPLR